MANQNEPSLLNAIIDYVQGLSPEDLLAKHSYIHQYIPDLSRYAIKTAHSELCQVLNRVIQISPIDWDLTDHEKQQILTLSGAQTTPVSSTGFFVQSDHTQGLRRPKNG